MNQQTKQTIIKKYGSWENYQAQARKNGHKGGSAKVKKGFSMMPKDRLKKLASKGGKVTSGKENV